ncbi:MAG: tyrosine-type recombinase/integrase [Candidatus Binatia bacterium]
MSAVHTFTSYLGPDIAAYIALKQALGRGFARETAILADLDAFLAGQSCDLGAESFAAWCLTIGRLTATVRRNWMRVARNVCLYRRRQDPGCFVPDPTGFPAPHPPRRPHIFTKDEVAQLLRAAARLAPTSTSPLYAPGMRLAVVLLYTTGLRRGELVRLLLSDYDPAARALLIRASKFHKSRVVALSTDATRELEAFLRNRHRWPHAPGAPLLVTWRHSGVRPYSDGGLGQALRRLFRAAGVRTAADRPPRVHDLRHTYAVHALLRWYHQGVDVQAKLPTLATAMGHVSIASTAYYLALLPPVAEAANQRFARHCAPLLAASPGDDR